MEVVGFMPFLFYFFLFFIINSIETANHLVQPPGSFTQPQIPQVDLLQIMAFRDFSLTQAEIEFDTSDIRKSGSPDCNLIGGRH